MVHLHIALAKVENNYLKQLLLHFLLYKPQPNRLILFIKNNNQERRKYLTLIKFSRSGLILPMICKSNIKVVIRLHCEIENFAGCSCIPMSIYTINWKCKTMNTLKSVIQKNNIVYRSNRSQTEIAITNEATVTMTTVIPRACTLALSLQKTTTVKFYSTACNFRQFISLVLPDNGLNLWHSISTELKYNHQMFRFH